MRTPILTIVALCLPLGAQSFLHLPATENPGSFELNKWNDVPFMRKDARVQVFYSAAEVGSASFTAREISLRYDGPIPRIGAPGPFTIQRLQIRVGTSTVAQPDSVFATNLSQPLTTVFDSQVSYFPDPQAGIPEPWGGPQNTLTFAFDNPLLVAVPANGWFVVEMIVENNSNDGMTHALLDAFADTSGWTDGFASSSGQGCPPGAGLGTARISTSGIHAPGAAHSIHGTNLGANAPVVAFIGASDTVSSIGPLPFTLPGTSCNIYTSWDLNRLTQADGTGSVRAFDRGTMVPVPADAAFNGLTVYEQLLSYVVQANAPWDFVLSDKRTVQLGSFFPPTKGVYTISSNDPGASVADFVGTRAYALRVRI